ncbi:MAG TPA: hypothetical protein VGN72_15945 [Tepidisphaeraceae bacterium]|nr:hypothetical protein [Tepidisphaeraceae bacterium]
MLLLQALPKGSEQQDEAAREEIEWQTSRARQLMDEAMRYARQTETPLPGRTVERSNEAPTLADPPAALREVAGIPAGSWPNWMGNWLGFYNTWESVMAQVLTALVVLGTWRVARWNAKRTSEQKRRERAIATSATPSMA